MLLEIILATLGISLVSLVGILISQKKIHKILHYLISFAAATLISVSLLDLVPHVLEESYLNVENLFFFLTMGIVLFFLVERFIHWHHCGKEDCSRKPAGSLILFGDFVHNFLDGLIIAGAFLLDTTTGLVTTLSVLIHEIPQEFGDFAVLIHSGFKKSKALLLNFVSALSAVLGGVLGFFVFTAVESIMPYAILIAAGGFLYIALSDIMPSMHKHKKDKKTGIIETIIFVATIIFFRFFLELTHMH